MGVFDKRHQDVDSSLQEGSRRQSTDVSVDRTEGKSTPGTTVWVPIGDNFVDQGFDLGTQERGPGKATKPSNRFIGRLTKENISVNKCVLRIHRNHSFRNVWR